MRLKSIQFKDHKILGNLFIDFTINNKPVDTVIIAGENGSGKSTLLNELYNIFSYQMNNEAKVVLDNNGAELKVKYEKIENIFKADFNGQKHHQSNLIRYIKFTTIFSDVDINFSPVDVSTVTSQTLDKKTQKEKSSSTIVKEINQLFIDICAQDDQDVSLRVKKGGEILNKNECLKNLKIDRFNRAFSEMFNNILYDRIDNINGAKKIIFKQNKLEICLDTFSSGEKQIVYRGAFLLKNINSMENGFVLIDEPEISMHPMWQKKIMSYYKKIFNDENGEQKAQIFATTHSPFIIHNENRYNDKIIILKKNDLGEISVLDNPDYYDCSSLKSVEQAFNIKDFTTTNKPTVFLEGRTDEKYFNKAIEVFEYKNLPFEFKWIGYVDENGQERNTGKDALKQAGEFLIAQNQNCLYAFLNDCDVKIAETSKNNVYITSWEKFSENTKMKKGIENALILGDLDISNCYETKEIIGDYGEKKTIEEFNKMRCAEKICSEDKELLKMVFANLKNKIDELTLIFKLGSTK